MTKCEKGSNNQVNSSRGFFLFNWQKNIQKGLKEEDVKKLLTDMKQVISNGDEKILTALESLHPVLESKLTLILTEVTEAKMKASDSLKDIAVDISDIKEKIEKVDFNELQKILQLKETNTEAFNNKLKEYQNNINLQIQQSSIMISQIELLHKKFDSQGETVKEVKRLVEGFAKGYEAWFMKIVDVIEKSKTAPDMKEFLKKEREEITDLITLMGSTVVDKIDEGNKKTQALLKMLLNKFDDIRKGTNDSSTIKIIDSLKEEIKHLRFEIGALETNSPSSNFPCPFCGSQKARVLIDYACHCQTCGHQFNVNPDISRIDDEKIKEDIEKNINTIKEKENLSIKEGGDWKNRHTAELDRAFMKGHENLYRMRLKDDTVSSKGILIIPNRTFDKGEITEIAFCEPNTDDKESIKRFEKVKTIILAHGVKLGSFDGKKPFPDREILYWDDKKVIINSEEKGEEAADA